MPLDKMPLWLYSATLSVCPTNSCTVSKRRKIEGQGFEAIMKCGNRSTCQDEYITCSVPQGGRKGNVLRRIAMYAHLSVRMCLCLLARLQGNGLTVLLPIFGHTVSQMTPLHFERNWMRNNGSGRDGHKFEWSAPWYSAFK